MSEDKKTYIWVGPGVKQQQGKDKKNLQPGDIIPDDFDEKALAKGLESNKIKVATLKAIPDINKAVKAESEDLKSENKKLKKELEKAKHKIAALEKEIENGLKSRLAKMEKELKEGTKK
jgi:predicted RNase H-like nuclease (RuvC/YqgF family)